jgi:hypothetical protein
MLWNFGINNLGIFCKFLHLSSHFFFTYFFICRSLLLAIPSPPPDSHSHPIPIRQLWPLHPKIFPPFCICCLPPCWHRPRVIPAGGPFPATFAAGWSGAGAVLLLWTDRYGAPAAPAETTATAAGRGRGGEEQRRNGFVQWELGMGLGGRGSKEAAGPRPSMTRLLMLMRNWANGRGAAGGVEGPFVLIEVFFSHFSFNPSLLFSFIIFLSTSSLFYTPSSSFLILCLRICIFLFFPPSFCTEKLLHLLSSFSSLLFLLHLPSFLLSPFPHHLSVIRQPPAAGRK